MILVAVGAYAGEETTPTQAALDALPTPAAAHAWEFRGYVLRDGRPYGTVTLSARPHAERDGYWAMRDEIVPRRPQDFATLQSAVLDRRLQTRSGRYHRRNTRGFLRARLERGDGGYRLEHESDYYENRLEVPGPAGVSTLAGLVTFLRHVPLAPAVYTLRDVDPDPSAGDTYAMPARVEVHRQAPWKVGGGTRRAWIASITRGKQTLRLALDPKSRALLGVDYLGLGIQLVPAGSGPVGLAGASGSHDLRTPLERAVQRTRQVRDRLDAPRRPLHVLGDVRLGDEAVGTVMLAAEPTSVDGVPAWRVLESRTIRVGEAVIEHEVSGFARQDLTVIRGERIDRRPEGTFHVTYARRPGGMETVAHTAAGSQAPVLLEAPARSMAGLVPLLLFLRAVPAEPASYVLPGFDPRFARKPTAGTGTFTLTRSDLHVRVEIERPVSRRLRLVAHCERRSGESFVVRLGLEKREFRSVRGVMPRLDLVRRGLQGGAAVDWYAAVEGTPTTWQQAFVKFGRGYHLPRRDLLADAFHWPSMARQAIEGKRYEPGTSEAKIREDWIDVFVGMSKQRTKADCDDLLFQMFATSEVTEQGDGSVSFRTLPAYGGHTYRMQAFDGRWWIVAID